MDDWLTAALEQAVSDDGRARAILVTVAIVEGSVPREPGTKMLVDAARQWGTVGGGHLELRGAEVARAMLACGEQRRLERFPLGPSLGQCCGGVVHLAFEAVDPAHLALLAARRSQDSWRLVAIDGDPDLALFDADGQPLADARPDVRASARAQAYAQVRALAREGAGARVLRDEDGRRWLADRIDAPRAHLMLFGAGHVGAAIVRALADLPCRVTWVDEREDLFPAALPHHVAVEATDMPEALAANAAPGTTFLVMTHSHALDQRVAEAILKRPSADWFGLIGSNTKRKQFEHRLRERGIPDARLDAMVCPIGVPGIEGKQPAVIAVAVAAQLLMVWEAQGARQAATHSERS
ncbi:xanthine dehydrogenase accessory protein XdhC [Massilia sp. 9096]|uniref:xanthine dehydrogenase accessory protein XdhC n=1 Tax=Massilia sp. 9096 TaxID=1500894 RepID=UPI00055FC4FD|nr:xanthine dehydrogenase accessory protein XdhC [Massilia sp. 9096]